MVEIMHNEAAANGPLDDGSWLIVILYIDLRRLWIGCNNESYSSEVGYPYYISYKSY